MWFCYSQANNGNYYPQITLSRPVESGPNGSKPKKRQVRKLNETEKTMSIETLQVLYPLTEEDDAT